ncbi:MAG TPA: HEAT repeat domain-containing protein [Candidatus Limnocylindrales bacterium]|nr:HEAT repeat domain-containing protein [Candidatus Limnocylindrales bacterium]
MKPTSRKSRLLHRILITLLAFLAIFSARRAASIPGPVLDLDALTEQSTVVAMGAVVSLQPGPDTELTDGSVTFEGRRIAVSLRVDRFLKGNLPSNEVSFYYLLPLAFRGWRTIALNQYGIFFLTETSDASLRLTSPYYPFVAALPGVPTSGVGPIDRVISALCGTALTPSGDDDQRLSAIRSLSRTKATSAVAKLRELTGVGPTPVRLEAAATLLRRNDISALDLVVDALLRNPADAPAAVLQDALAAIASNVTNPEAVPALTTLLRSDDVEVRRAGSSGLMRTRSPGAAQPLLSALADSDFEVRYYAVVGLAEIAGQPEWRPTIDQFRANEERYLQHWTGWSPTDKHR